MSSHLCVFTSSVTGAVAFRVNRGIICPVACEFSSQLAETEKSHPMGGKNNNYGTE